MLSVMKHTKIAIILFLEIWNHINFTDWIYADFIHTQYKWMNATKQNLITFKQRILPVYLETNILRVSFSIFCFKLIKNKRSLF